MRFVVTVLVATAAWHLLAAYHFTLFPERTLLRTTSERPPNAVARELLRFLGGLNLALAALGLLAAGCYPAGRVVALATLMIANLTQAVIDVRVLRAGFAKGRFFLQILIGDVGFTLLTLLALARGA